MYKLLALDLDGTLLDNQGGLSSKQILAVRKAQEAGVTVVLATGRYYMQTKRIIDQLGFKGLLVSNDGAVTIKTNTKEILHEFSYSINEVAPLIYYCRKHNIHFSVCTAFDYFVEFMDDYQEEKHKKYEIAHTIHYDVLTLKEKVMKFTVHDVNRKEGWQNIGLSESLKRKVDGEFFKEFVHQEASKTSGLKKVLEHLNISPSEMIAIGDYYNDLDMIEYAGLGIAMGNAPEEVKQKANAITLSNEEDGVYYAVEKYILNT